MANCIIVHGTMGCPDENWFLWAQTEIAKVLNCKKYEVLTPHFPYIVGYNESEGYNLWKKLMMVYKEAGLINEETILIGHSLGPVFICRFLIETQTKVKAVISVSGKNNNWLNIKAFDSFNFDFYCNASILKETEKYAKYRYAFFSDNDPYIPLINCKKFADSINAEQLLIKDAGHINTAYGYSQFPELIELIKKIENGEASENNEYGKKDYVGLEEPLAKSADIISEKARSLCKGGLIDQKGCCWYHSTWQYLRLMDMVSTPSWHDTFYQKNLDNALESNRINRILISGSADYSTLAYVINSVKLKNVEYEIVVLDTCKTPLYACKWYADREGVNITCVNEDILKYENSEYFDIICTDAFLTRFGKENAQKVVDKWKSFLKPNGKIITTVREHEKDDTNYSEETILEFKQKAKERAARLQDVIQYSPNKIAELSEQYARSMKSSDLGKKEDIIDLFRDFKMEYCESVVLGELVRTKYMEIVAEKR